MCAFVCGERVSLVSGLCGFVCCEMSPMTETEGRLTKVYIVYYSMYGYIHHMAKAVKKGVDSVPGCKGVLYQVRGSWGPQLEIGMHAVMD